MHGRYLLLIFLLLSSFHLPLRAQEADLEDEFGEFEETPSSTSAEPTPSESLAPATKKEAQSASQEVDEFEEFTDEPAQATETPPPEQTPAENPSVQSQPEPTTPSEEPAQATEAPPAQEAPPVEPPPAPAPVPVVAKPTSDEPDFKREERFHDVYSKYNQSPTSYEAWNRAVTSSNGMAYDIQDKDTLWDVSNTLFGDPQFWPKVWSLNSDVVLNPHEISPGMRIKFFPGSLTEAPSLAVVEEKPAPKLAKNESEKATSVDADPVMPEPGFKSRKLSQLPSSLPLYRFATVNKPKPKVDIQNLHTSYHTPLSSLTHYVSDSKVEGLGVVSESELGMSSAAEFQYIVVEIENPTEKVYHVEQEMRTIKNPYIKSSSVGHMMEVQGEIEIIERVDDSGNFYRAVVTKSLAPIKIGALLLPGPAPVLDSSMTEPVQGPESTIVGGQFDGDRQMFGIYSLVFLDSGKGEGLQEGQTLNVYESLKNRKGASRVRARAKLIGEVKLIKVADNFSTAVITHAIEEIRSGDTVGGSGVPAKLSE